MLMSGFFNSIGADRTYDADSFNTFFEGLISKNGIFENVGRGFSVTSGGGLVINVNDGKAIVNNKWIRNDATETIELDAGHSLFNRYDMITLRWDGSTRTITLEKTTGTPSSTEEKPTPIRNVSQYEIVLAYVYVKAGSTNITAANIIDCRYDNDLCGIITGLIDQVNITNLYNQFATKFQELSNQMEAWQNSQKTAYDEWFNALTGDSQVNTNLTRTIANHLTTREAGTQYIDLPSELNYEDGDILDVFVNGILMIEGTDYDLMMNEVENVPMIYLYSDVEINNMITFYCLKSVVGA